MPISQIINLEGIDEDCTCCVSLPVTSLEVLPKADQAGDNRLIDISVRVGAGVKAYREMSLPVVTDAYSVCCNLETKSRNIDFSVIADRFSDTFTCRSTQDLPEAKQILALWCSDLSKSVSQDSDGVIISGELTLHFLYSDAEEQPCYAQRQASYEYRRSVRKCGELSLSPCIEITAASAACVSGSARGAGRNAYFRLYLRQRPPQDSHLDRVRRHRKQKIGRRRADSLFCRRGRGNLGYSAAL